MVVLSTGTRHAARKDGVAIVRGLGVTGRREEEGGWVVVGGGGGDDRYG